MADVGHRTTPPDPTVEAASLGSPAGSQHNLGSLLAALPTGSTCAACATASTGGTCPNCGLYWFRNEVGKMVGARLRAQVVQPGKPPEENGDFWRSGPDLRASLERADCMDPRFAEAVNALGRLWNIITFKLLSDQQGVAMILCHTHPGMTSRRLAEALKISHQAAANVLRVLVDRGLLNRERNGRNITYAAAVLWPVGQVSTAARVVELRAKKATS